MLDFVVCYCEAYNTHSHFIYKTERRSLNENNLKDGRARKPHTNRSRKPDDTMRLSASTSKLPEVGHILLYIQGTWVELTFTYNPKHLNLDIRKRATYCGKDHF